MSHTGKIGICRAAIAAMKMLLPFLIPCAALPVVSIVNLDKHLLHG
jgi:hypothetical protein